MNRELLDFFHFTLSIFRFLLTFITLSSSPPPTLSTSLPVHLFQRSSNNNFLLHGYPFLDTSTKCITDLDTWNFGARHTKLLPHIMGKHQTRPWLYDTSRYRASPTCEISEGITLLLKTQPNTQVPPVHIFFASWCTHNAHYVFKVVDSTLKPASQNLFPRPRRGHINEWLLWRVLTEYLQDDILTRRPSTTLATQRVSPSNTDAPRKRDKLLPLSSMNIHLSSGEIPPISAPLHKFKPFQMLHPECFRVSHFASGKWWGYFEYGWSELLCWSHCHSDARRRDHEIYHLTPATFSLRHALQHS